MASDVAVATAAGFFDGFSQMVTLFVPPPLLESGAVSNVSSHSAEENDPRVGCFPAFGDTSV